MWAGIDFDAIKPYIAPMRRAFTKMHGLGNDFVLFDARQTPLALTAEQVRALADRQTGIGCDQLIVIGASEQADAAMRIWNHDGSEVAACGNATRCVAALLGGDVRLETKAGLLHATRAPAGIAVDMGQPRFDWRDIPLAYAMDTLHMPVSWDDLPAPVAVNVGNPHVIFFVDDIGAIDIDALGARIETDALFPERVNVNFAQVIDRTHINLIVWERGAGRTRACGTGACATAVAAMRRQLTEREVRVDLPGGPLMIRWDAAQHIHMTGPATLSFIGEIHL